MNPVLQNNVVVHRQGNKTLLVNPETQRWIVTNEAGVLVLHLCDGSRSVDEVGAELRLDSDQMRALRDVIAQLEQAGILRGSPDPDPACGSGGCLCDGPSSLHLEITNKCNLKCVHCYVDAGKPMVDELSFTEICRVVEEFVEISAGKPGPIAITGGEARLRKDCLDIIRHIRGRGIEVVLFTDAVGVRPDFAAALAEMGAAVQVSLDGPDAATNDPIRGKGTYKRIVDGISTMLAHGLGPTMTIFVTLTRGTIEVASKMIEQAEAWGVDRLHFSQLNGQGRAKQMWDSLAPTSVQWIELGRALSERHDSKVRVTGNAYGGLSVGGGRFPKMCCQIPSSPRIDCVGNVYPCQLFVEPEFRIGNIRRQPLGEILTSNRIGSLAREIEGRAGAIEKCASCNWRQLCQSGCPGHAYSEFGTLLHEDSLCDVRLHWFNAAAQEALNGGDGAHMISAQQKWSM